MGLPLYAKRKLILPIFWLGLFLSFISNNYAQGVKGFTLDKAVFMSEMKNFFEEADKKPGRDFVEEYTLFWNSGKLSETQKEDIIRICNIMYKKRLKAFPEFKNYLSTVKSFTESSQSEQSFLAWQQSLDKLMNGKIFRKFVDYLAISSSLFKDNSLYESASVKWRSANNNYTFQFDSVPKIIFGKTDLSCIAKGDSSIIYGTEGIYYPTNLLWIGKGGKIKWLRADFDESVMYADFNHRYKVNINTTQYTIDSVLYYNKKYFTKPLLGKLIEKCISGEKGEQANYPQFESYDLRLKINNIAQGVDYDGGFSMRGAKFVGSGTKESNALLKFKRKDTLFLVASSKSFIIRPDQITASRASVQFLNGKDSIFHPGLVFKFSTTTRQVTLIRDEQGMALAPYYDSYHKLDMYFEALYWKLDENFIDMKRLLGSSATQANFESNDYYREIRFYKIQGMDDVNPLFKLRDCAKQQNSNTFTAEDYARFVRLSGDAVRPLLMTLATKGFVDFDVDKDLITLKNRTFHYIKARTGQTDYDLIEFNSDIKEQANATLNLLNWDLKIRGVDVIQMSDSQNVFIQPQNREIIVKKNRDFIFAGKVNAGRFEYYGEEFSFEYKTFKINLVNTMVRIKVQSHEKDENGAYPLIRCKTALEQVDGELLIDHPNNKSGQRSFPQFPVFTSSKPSFAYYDNKQIFGGVYERGSFYFKLDPFTIDSLDNFSNNSLNFAGSFSSSGIFPEFRENLRLQEDYSLGFIRPTPAEGFDVYKGKAKYSNLVKLSNQGLRGDGTLDYITSSTKSNDFFFFPDSTNALAQKFDIRAQTGKVEYPEVHGEDVKIHYRPYKDYLKTYTIKTPLKMYGGRSEFLGVTTYSPTEFNGKGKSMFSGAELVSENTIFKQMTLDADTSDFSILDEGTSDLSFATNNVKAHVDFEKKYGEFKSNGKGSVVKFPANQYICYMDKFKWFMESKDIELSAGGSTKGASADTSRDVDIEGAEFISVHPDQDSLRFNSPAARYDVKNKVIYAKEVKFINVADARIYPDSGKVTVQKKAKIDELRNSSILANTVTKYHKLYKTNINIYGRKNYSGTGYYDYIDETHTTFPIFFSNIGVDTTGQTTASTEIADTAKFALSPNFDYKGKLQLYASNSFLFYDGSTKIEHACTGIPKTWYNFKAEVNPREIYIPVDFTVKAGSGDQNDKTAAGIILTTDSTHIYSAFLSRKNNYSDIDVITADGFLFYDKNNKEYRIANKEKLKETNLPGNFISLNTNNCIVYGEGKVNLGADLGRIDLKTFGNGTNNLNDGESKFDLVSTVDFFFADDAMKLLAEALQNSTGDAINYSRPVYEKSIREMLGKVEADKIISQLNLYGSFKKFPSELEHTMLLGDLKLKWNPETKSYVSDGKIGIASMGKNQINKLVEGKIELVKKRSGDILNIYIQIDANNWYFFNYQTNLMQGISTDTKFNTIIKELKPDKRKLESEKGLKQYTYILSTEKKKKDFLKKFEAKSEEE